MWCAGAGAVATSTLFPAGGVAIVVAVMAVAAVIDHREGRLPDAFVVLSALALVGPIVRSTAAHGPQPTMSMATGMLALVVLPLTTHLVVPATVGFGDVKAAAVLGAALGTIHPRSAVWGLWLASAFGLVTGLRRGSPVAFGPCLVAGTAVVAVVATATPPALVPTW